MSLAGILNQPDNDLDVVVITDEEIQGAIQELGQLPANSPVRKKFTNKLKKGLMASSRNGRSAATVDLTAKAEFEKRISMLPEHIQTDLRNNRLQIVEGDIYSIKSISEKSSIELLENKDDKTLGLTNLNSRKLDANQYFLVTGLVLRYAVAAGTTDDNIKAADYKEELPAFIKNGEFQVELGTEVLLPEVSAEIFDTRGRTDIPQGYYRLANPKWLKPLTEIKPELKFANVAAVNAAVKFRLIGATTAKK